MPDHERIWLQNAEDAKNSREGRMWCQDKVWPDDPEDGEPTEYIRADLVPALTAQPAEAGVTVPEARKLLLWAADSFVAHSKCTDVPEEIEGYLGSAEMYRKCASALVPTPTTQGMDTAVEAAKEAVWNTDAPEYKRDYLMHDNIMRAALAGSKEGSRDE